MPYDPQRSHRRPRLAEDEPAPIDALLEPHPAVSGLPDGVEVDVVEGEVVVHTSDADIEISASGDDIVVHTDDADIEVLPESDEVLVSSATETSTSIWPRARRGPSRPTAPTDASCSSSASWSPCSWRS